MAGDLAFSGSARFFGESYVFEGRTVGGVLSVTGDYGLVFTGRIIGSTVLASLRTQALPLPLPWVSLIVSVDADAKFDSLSDWSLALGSLSIQPLAKGGDNQVLPTLTLSGLVGPEGGSFRSARLSDAISSVNGSGNLVIGKDTSDFKATLDLASKAGESYGLTVSLSSGALAGILKVKGSPLARFAPGGLKGGLDGTFLLSGTLGAPEVAYDAAVSQGQYAGYALILELKGGLSSVGISINDGHCLWNGYELSRPRGRLELTTGIGELSGRFDSHTTLRGIGFDFSARSASRASPGSGIAALFGDCRITGQFVDFTFKNMRQGLWPYLVDISPRGIQVQGGTATELTASVLADGTFSARAIAPFPLLFDLKGRTRGDQLELEAKGLSVDLSILLAFAGKLAVEFQGGRVSGDFYAKGPVSDPEFSGALRVDDCRLSVPGWINEVAGPMSAPVVVDGKRLFLQAPSIPILSSKFALTLEMIFEGWTPTDYRIGIRSLPGTIVPIDAKVLGVSIKGSAVPNLDFRIYGPLISIKGSLLLQQSDLVVSPETLATSVGGIGSPDSLLDVDLGVDFGKGVTVYFPDRYFPVMIAGNTDPSSHLAVHYDQPADELSVKGDLYLRGGDAFYIQRNFFLKSARISFNESFRNFDPLITLVAELRDSSDKGPVIISLKADSAHLRNFQPRLLSEPPMSESDIALLLGQGLLSVGDTGDIDARRLAITGSEFIPGLNFTKVFETAIRETLKLDVFYVNSMVLQRLLFQYMGAGSATPPTLGDYLQETSLYAGMYLSDAIFLHGSARLTTDPLVSPVALGLDSEIGVDFETPFGLLQWNFRPQHPAQLFVNDQSLSLSWRLPLR
jgi:hypothetical protein